MRPAAIFALAAAIGGAALAQQGEPGAHFIENWDMDANGAVSLDEARQKRADLFTMFDQDENGVLDPAEYALFDQTRQDDMAVNAGGHGKGPMRIVNDGLTLPFNDIDGDGSVSADEFLNRVPDWFDTMDRTGDGVVTTGDFAAGNG
ncbi:EF-hand domain-containing protein [Sedimentitalea sp. JM2-8]|uniref:EF-hand domain-containing protein n=1 Tax=Sedimentitalea xiamensis TaxID=3050037 RepID=A0ABT7FFX0_9RHOB|nr:EF-hand domain-containing protein [Sedimentitalea xiamensis]MDK3073978.1 EF-hand domain-containing protein [Sedimentitalea xiamensis]